MQKITTPAEQNPITEVNTWLTAGTFRNSQILAAANNNGTDVDDNSWGIAANVITGDRSSALASNPGARKSMQTSLDARTTTRTKDGVSTQPLRTRKKDKKKMSPAEAAAAKDKRFCSNGLSKTKLAGPLPVMKSLTPPQFKCPQAAIEICDSPPSPPTGLPPVESPVRSPPSRCNVIGERKSKLRCQLGLSIFSLNQNASNEITVIKILGSSSKAPMNIWQ